MLYQSGANVNDSKQPIELIFGENNNYHRTGKSYISTDEGAKKKDRVSSTETEDQFSFYCLCVPSGKTFENNWRISYR